MHRRARRIVRRPAVAVFVMVFALMILLFVNASAAGEDEAQWTPADAAVLASVVGHPDAGRLSRAAQVLGSAKLIAAIYRGSRAERYAALDAAPYSDSPWELLPSLAALMAASERGTAVRAAASLQAIVADPSSHARCFQERTDGQVTQLIEQLAPLSGDGRLDPDIRIAAIVGIDRLTAFSETKSCDWTLPLFDDAEKSIRRAAVEVQSLPLTDEMLRRVAKTVNGDASAEVRGVAAALLCENAVAHKVKEPSPDLTEMLKGVLREGTVPPDVEAGILVCLTRFDPSSRRREIIAAAAGDERSEISALLKSLSLN